MKVFIISRGVPTKDYPMNGIFEWDQAKALHEAGIEVVYIVLDLRSFLRRRRLSTYELKNEGINVIYGSLPLGAIPAPLFFHLGCLKLRKLIKRAIKEFGKPDLVHAHFTNIGAISLTVCEMLKIPCIITEHSSSLNRDVLDSKTLYFAKRAYSHASNVLVVSEKLKERLKQHFNIEANVIPNVVDTHAIQFQREKRNGSKIVFVSTGNLLTRKGYDLLVSSLENIPQDSYELLIIGDGPERTNLKNQISRAGLENNIKLLGSLNRSEISKIYANADCFVLSSRRETFGVVYIEAMFAGLPVIATRCGGPEDFVNSSNGILIDVDNVKQLSDAIKRMILESRDFKACEIHNYALNSFSPRTIADKLIKFYSQVVK